MDSERSPTIQNPFEDHLANSENLPIIQKLEVKINDDYLAQYNPNEHEEESDKLRHNENIKKRKNLRGKK